MQNSLAGVDIICQAQSGMGKTAVFVLTILNRLQSTDPCFSVIVLCHTRELTIQINNEFKRFSTNMDGISSMPIYGGENLDDQIKKIKEINPKIIVGTPGRTLALIKKGIITTSNVSMFVLDECDKCLQQLDMRGDIQQIYKSTPHKKQVLFFSATMPKDIRELAKKFMNKVCFNPIILECLKVYISTTLFYKQFWWKVLKH